MASVSKISHREGSVSSGTSVRACLVCSYDLTWCVVVPSSYTWLYCDTRAIYDFVATCDPFIGVWHVRLHLPAFAYVNLFCLFRDIVPPARQEAVLLLYVSVSCFPEVFSLSLVLCRFFLSRSFSLRFSSERVAVAVYSHISMSVCFASLAISSHQPDKKQSYRMSINSQFVQPPRKPAQQAVHSPTSTPRLPHRPDPPPNSTPSRSGAGGEAPPQRAAAKPNPPSRPKAPSFPNAASGGYHNASFAGNGNRNNDKAENSSTNGFALSISTQKSVSNFSGYINAVMDDEQSASVESRKSTPTSQSARPQAIGDNKFVNQDAAAKSGFVSDTTSVNQGRSTFPRGWPGSSRSSHASTSSFIAGRPHAASAHAGKPPAASSRVAGRPHAASSHAVAGGRSSYPVPAVAGRSFSKAPPAKPPPARPPPPHSNGITHV